MSAEVQQFLQITECDLSPEDVQTFINNCGSLESAVSAYFESQTSESHAPFGPPPPTNNNTLHSTPGFQSLEKLALAPPLSVYQPRNFLAKLILQIFEFVYKLFTGQLFRTSKRVNLETENQIIDLHLRDHCLKILNGSYKEAIKEMHKQRCYLLVVLYDDLKLDLLNELLNLELNAETLVWFGNTNLEEPQLVQRAYNLNTPCFVCLGPTIGIDEFGTQLIDTQVLVLGKVQGFRAVNAVMNNVFESHKPVLDAVIYEQNQRELDRKIKLESQSAYERSLEQDRLKKMEKVSIELVNNYSINVLNEMSTTATTGHTGGGQQIKVRSGSSSIVLHISRDHTMQDVYLAVHAWLSKKELQSIEENNIDLKQAISSFKPEFMLKCPLIRKTMEYNTELVSEISNLKPSGVLVVDM